MTLPFAFHDLPQHMFPFTVHWLDVHTDRVLHAATVKEPGVLYVPPVGRQNDTVVKVRVKWGDGTVTEYLP